MDERYGHAGKILHIDLTTSRIRTEPTARYTSRFPGGRGINQWILLNELDPQVKPFDPENIICFGAGALTGTLVPGAARLNIDSKNALTGGIGSGNAGGWFAAELKYAGYDNIVVRGKAEEPVYIWIEDDSVSLQSAVRHWGKGTGDTLKDIREELGCEDAEIVCIGPAGENMARQACIIVSGSRAVGRCGLGAVMGSKNLKAVAVKGTGSVRVRSAEAFMKLAKTVSQRLNTIPGAIARREHGTLVGTPMYQSLSAIPYKNYDDDYIPEERFQKISHETFHSVFETDRYACSACPTPCGHVYTIDEGPYKGTRCLKAEANSVWNFGGRVAVDDPAAILALQEECCRLGLDIDNTSSVLGWAIDCFQNGLLSTGETDGMELQWGDHGVLFELLGKIARREGIGDLLAEGSLRASAALGQGSDRYAFHMKGQDMIEAVRSMKGWALGVAVSPRGGAHTRGAPATETRKFSAEDSMKLFGVSTAGEAQTYVGKSKVVTYFEKVHALLDSMGVCFFTGTWTSPDGVSPGDMANFYTLATGIPIDEEELLTIGERVHTVEKMFNIRHRGFTRKDDYPPKRLMEEPIKSGPLKGEMLKREDWDRMLDEYYELHGWDLEDGWPSESVLERLDLPECTEMLAEAKRRKTD